MAVEATMVADIKAQTLIDREGHRNSNCSYGGVANIYGSRSCLGGQANGFRGHNGGCNQGRYYN